MEDDLKQEIKAEVIKWIKEEIQKIKDYFEEYGFEDIVSSTGATSGLGKVLGGEDKVPMMMLLQIRRWMKRFNITEEDLKEEKGK